MNFQVVKKLKHFTSVFLALVMVLSVAVMPSVSVYAYEPDEIGDVVYEMGYGESYGYEVDEEVAVDEPWYVEDDDVLDEPWYGVGDEDEYLDDEDLDIEDELYDLAAESAMYVDIMPLMVLGVDIVTDLVGDVAPNAEIRVTARWFSRATLTHPVTIRVTNGAEVLADYATDITFTAGGSEVPINNFVAGDGVVTFTTSTLADAPLANEITFSIQAPPTEGYFDLTVRVGPGTNYEYGNYDVKTFNVVTSFIVETSSDIIVGDERFDVFGNVGREFTNGNYFVGFDFIHVETGTISAMYSTTPEPNGDFFFGDVQFPDDAPLAGIFQVKAVLVCRITFEEITSIPIEIERVMSVLQPTNPRCADTNLAYWRNGTEMSASPSIRPPGNANNGDKDVSRIGQISWQPDTLGRATLTARFETVKEFNRVVIYQHGFRLRDYEVEYSIDGTTWHNFTYAERFLGNPAILDYTRPVRAVGQYVRLVIGHTEGNPPAVIIEFEVYNMPGPDDAQMYTLTIYKRCIDTGNDLQQPVVQQRPYGYVVPVNASDIQGFTPVRKVTGGQTVRTFIYPSRHPNPAEQTLYVTITGDTEVIIKYGAPRTLTRRYVNNAGGGYVDLRQFGYPLGGWPNSVITLPHGTLLILNVSPAFGNLYRFHSATANGVSKPVGELFIMPPILLDEDVVVTFRYTRR